MKKLILALIIITLFSGCASYSIIYDLTLTGVEPPSPREHTIERGQEYSDSTISILFQISTNGVGFSLTNKTNHTIRLPWDDAAYINSEGQSMRVIHQGTKFINKNEQQTPTVLARGTTINNLMIPAENVYYDAVLGWMINPIITKGDIGRDVKIFLPLDINNTTQEYIFIVTVNNVVVNKSW